MHKIDFGRKNFCGHQKNQNVRKTSDALQKVNEINEYTTILNILINNVTYILIFDHITDNII